MGDGRWEMESERWVEYRKGKVNGFDSIDSIDRV